jgi:hypothetical protein
MAFSLFGPEIEDWKNGPIIRLRRAMQSIERLRGMGLKIQGLKFDHEIRTTQLANGKWIYVIRVGTETSRPSVKFPTQEDALNDAKVLLHYMQ